MTSFFFNIHDVLYIYIYMWKWKSFSPTLVTPWTTQSMEFSSPEYWSGYPFPSPGIFPAQGLNPGLPHYRRILYQLSHKGSPMYFWSHHMAYEILVPWRGIEPMPSALKAWGVLTSLPGKSRCTIICFTGVKGSDSQFLKVIYATFSY